MTPKEKANELNEKFMLTVDGANGFKISFRKHAIICVDEIIKSQPIEPNNSKPFGVKIQSVRQNFTDADEYWNAVKQELELLQNIKNKMSGNVLQLINRLAVYVIGSAKSKD